MSTFAAELRRLTQHCNFGAALEDMIRDRFVCGINDGVIQHRLLAMKDLKLADALATALLIEAADRDAQELQSALALVLLILQ